MKKLIRNNKNDLIKPLYIFSIILIMNKIVTLTKNKSNN